MDYRLERSWRKSLKVEVVEGEVVVKAPKWLSRKRIEAFMQKHSDWIERRLFRWRELQNHYYLFGRRLKRGEEDVEALWREQMERVVIPRAWDLAKHFGDTPKAIKISRAKKRWGSCSSKKTIHLSFRLAQLPKGVIDYVIIHELCHLTHMNHSRAFWELVEKRCPDYKVKEAKLREYY